MKQLSPAKLALISIIATLIAAFIYLDAGQYLNFEYFKSQQQAFEQFYQANLILTVISYFVIYVLVTALSLPGATILTLAGGALFGLLFGTVIISFASTVGATLAFLMSRFLLREFVQKRFGDKLQAINDGIEKEGAFYLFSLRLIPLFPFFVINLVMGLTPIKTLRYYWVSQLGMFPGTIVYVNAGTQLGALESPTGIFSLPVLLSFAALGLFPLIAKKSIGAYKARQA